MAKKALAEAISANGQYEQNNVEEIRIRANKTLEIFDRKVKCCYLSN